jgi:hypothetical protein
MLILMYHLRSIGDVVKNNKERIVSVEAMDEIKE